MQYITIFIHAFDYTQKLFHIMNNEEKSIIAQMLLLRKYILYTYCS